MGGVEAVNAMINHEWVFRDECSTHVLFGGPTGVLSVNQRLKPECAIARLCVDVPTVAGGSGTWDASLLMASSWRRLISGVPGQLPPPRVPCVGWGWVRGSPSPSGHSV